MSNFQGIGQKFRDQRVLRKLSIQEISDNTLINSAYLQAIEDGDFSVFPAIAFAKAYFKKYADYLGLIIEFPSQTKGASEKKNNEETFVKQKGPNQITFSLWASLGLFFILLLLFLVFSPLFSNISSMSNDSYNDLDSSQQATKSGLDILEEEFSTLEVKIDKEEPSQIYIPIYPTEISEEIAEDTLLLESKSSTLEIKFTGDSWIEIYKADEPLIYELFKSGKTFEMIIDKPFWMVIGNSKNTELYYEGDKIDLTSIANSKNVSVVTFDD